MGNRPRRRCSAKLCPNAATNRGRCPDHQHTDADRSTPHRTDVYHSARWRKLRAKVLAERPVCQHERCTQQPTEVDHIIDLNDGGDPWDEGNLQALCKPHHSAKTARARARRRRTG